MFIGDLYVVFCEMSVKVSRHLKIGLFVFLFLTCRNTLNILDKTLSDKCIAYFSQPIAYIFNFLNGVL